MSLEVVRCLQGFPDNSVVVNFPIDCKCNAIVLVGKGLGTTVNTDNTQTLVGKNWGLLAIKQPRDLFLRTCVVGHIASRPIWSTMAALLHHLEGGRLEGLRIGHMMAPYYATHLGALKGVYCVLKDC